MSYQRSDECDLEMGGDTRLDDRGGTAAVVAPVWRDAILRR